MDFRLSPSEEKWRQDVRAFLSEALPSDYEGDVGVGGPGDIDMGRAFNKKLAERGWMAPAWPRAYGGLDASFVEQLIFNEELSYYRAPEGMRVFAIGMIGPTLIVHGSDAQKREYLPRITGAEVIWCQGYSEPGAGSDLASLQTRAVRDGDDYVINGQKIWTTGAHVADWIFVLTRTNPDAPKHKGISFFLADMKSPGINVRPIINMAGEHHFNEVFFEDVRVPARNMVGPENGGWYVAMTLLDFERSSIGAVASGRRTLDDLTVYAKERRVNGKPLAGQPQVRYKLAELTLEFEVGRWFGYSIASMQQRGQIPNREASQAKVFATELNQRLHNFGIGILGLYGGLEPRSRYAPLHGVIEIGHLVNVAPTIYSGTNEIQRNIIAQRGLGLPRD